MHRIKKIILIVLVITAIASLALNPTKGSSTLGANVFSIPSLGSLNIKNTSNRAAAHNVVVILYTFANEASVPKPFTFEDVRKNIFDPNPTTGLTMSQFLSLSTYGNITLTGKTSVTGATDVHGWYTVPDTRTGCGTSQVIANIPAASIHAVQQAVADGVVIDEDDIVVVGTFPNGCTTGGQANFDIIPGTQKGIRLAMMNNAIDWSGTLHEISHVATAARAFPISHANSLECIDQNKTLVPFAQGTQTCTVLEYGSPLSVLGGYISGAPKTRLFDAANRIASGFFNPATTSITQPGTYDIKKINSPLGSLLEIPLREIKILNVNGKPMFTNTSTTRVRVEARDFLPFEQDVDTYPNNSMLALTVNNAVIANAGLKKLIAPGTSSTLDQFQTTVANLGSSPSDPDSVRVQVTYSGSQPTPFTASSSQSVTINPLVVNLSVSANGAIQKQLVTFRNTSTEPLTFTTNFTDSAQVIYPLNAGFPMSPFAAGYSVGLGSVVITLQPQESKSVPLFNQGAISPNILVPATPRWIYKMITNIEQKGTSNEIKLTSYLIYGKFSITELLNLGVPTIQTKVDNIKPVKALSGSVDTSI